MLMLLERKRAKGMTKGGYTSDLSIDEKVKDNKYKSAMEEVGNEETA